MDDWRARVDQSLVNLTSAQRVTDDQLDDLELKYEALDKVLRGDPEKDTDGVIARLHNLETSLNAIHAERLKIQIADDNTRGIKWQVWGSIVVAIIGALAGILPNLGRIKISLTPFSKIQYEPDTKLQREIEADKRKHHKKQPQWKTNANQALSVSTEATHLNP